MGAPGVDRKVISGLCCVDRMKASVVRPDGVGDGALGDPRDKRRGPCYSALGALQEVVISHDIFSADHHAEVARSRPGISAFSPCPVKSQFGYTVSLYGFILSRTYTHTPFNYTFSTTTKHERCVCVRDKILYRIIEVRGFSRERAQWPFPYIPDHF